MTRILSVDLGTTYSAAAVANGHTIEIFPLGTRTQTVPTTVAVREDGSVVVGEAAERRGLSEPTRVSREFKRRLGDPVPIVIGGTPFGAETLMAHVLRWIVERVTEEQGAAPDRVVLTHPADYGPYKLDLLEQVGRLAGLDAVEFVTEPEAAAVHYFRQERIEQGEIVAVSDLGGGTFDGALIKEAGGRFELIGRPEGMDRFGGIDLDEAVFVHVRNALGQALDGLDTTDPAVVAGLARLRDDCRIAKESLSSETEATVLVMLPSLHTEVRLTRSEFEDMIRPRLRETLSTLDRVVRSAGLEWSDVARVLLVGGSSRIPLVSEMVRAHTGCAVALDTNPKNAIALGAAAAAIENATRAGARGSAPATQEPSPGANTLATDPAESPGWSTPAHMPPVAGSPPAATGDDRPSRRRSRRSFLVGGVVAVVAVGASLVGAVALLGGGDDDAAPLSDSSAIPVLAIYVADYAVPERHDSWGAWAVGPDPDPPVDVAADYYPILGPYDSTDPEAVAQHMVWLRDAGIDGIIVPWRGEASISAEAAPLLLTAGEEFGVRVALSIDGEDLAPEEFLARAEAALTAHGSHENYLRTEIVDHEGRSSARALLFLVPPIDAAPGNWAEEIAVVRQLGGGTAVVVVSPDPRWDELTDIDGVAGGRREDGYGWATGIDTATWYVPTVAPGASAQRVAEPLEASRAEGQTYRESWDLAMSLRRPEFVIVESFNQWVIGTQIEPATVDVPRRSELPYVSYEPLPPDGYVTLTRELVDTYVR